MKSSDPDVSPPAGASRRLLFAGVAGGAALAGAGLAWWRLRPGDLAPGVAGEAGQLWNLAFDTPEGGRLAMAAFKGRPLLVNFWATWCPPCVEELPLLNQFHQERASAGWQVVGLALDKPEAVQAFLKKIPLQFPVGIAAAEGAALSKSLGNVAGGLPFTVVLGEKGGVLHRKMGKVLASELEQWSAIR
ncbi:MAG: TlpA family protein disulfide reductase [Burkholderiaceae bacterium]|nr:TlpA family protein disulfide reductase [Burkholderiaceae bacterium]